MKIIPGVHDIDKLSIGRAYLYAEADRLTSLAGSPAGDYAPAWAPAL